MTTFEGLGVDISSMPHSERGGWKGVSIPLPDESGRGEREEGVQCSPPAPPLPTPIGLDTSKVKLRTCFSFSHAAPSWATKTSFLTGENMGTNLTKHYMFKGTTATLSLLLETCITSSRDDNFLFLEMKKVVDITVGRCVKSVLPLIVRVGGLQAHFSACKTTSTGYASSSTKAWCLRAVSCYRKMGLRDASSPEKSTHMIHICRSWPHFASPFLSSLKLRTLFRPLPPLWSVTCGQHFVVLTQTYCDGLIMSDFNRVVIRNA